MKDREDWLSSTTTSGECICLIRISEVAAVVVEMFGSRVYLKNGSSISIPRATAVDYASLMYSHINKG